MWTITDDAYNKYENIKMKYNLLGTLFYKIMDEVWALSTVHAYILKMAELEQVI